MDQITVNESVVPGAITSLARQIGLVIGGWLVGKGYLDNDTATMLGTLGLIVLPLVYGQVKNWMTHRKLVTLANASPDAMAIVK